MAMYRDNSKYRGGVSSMYDAEDIDGLSNTWRACRNKLYSQTGSPVINYRLMTRCFDVNQREMTYYVWAKMHEGHEKRFIKPIRSHLTGKRLFTSEAYDPRSVSLILYQDIELDQEALSKVGAQVLLLDDSYNDQ